MPTKYRSKYTGVIHNTKEAAIRDNWLYLNSMPTKNKRSLEDGGKQERANAAKAANARERNIAQQYLNAGPSISNLARAAYHWYNSVPRLGGQDESGLILNMGEAPAPGMRNPKAIVDGIKNANKYIKLVKESTKMQNYAKVGKRYSESKDIMSDGWPIEDILHLKIPDGTHSSLGIGNYYRAIGNREGLKSVIENGVVAPKGQFSREGKVFWNDGYLDRTYSGKGIFALSYDKAGKAKFYSGNKPQRTYVYSSNDTPIDFYDEALGLHARIPFTQTYKEIPKTQEGIDYALKLDKINRYVEKPAHVVYNFGFKPYIGYEVYNHYKNKNKKRNGGSIHIAPSKRGTFTAAATKHGMGVQEFASRVLRNKEDYSPAMVKKANFARNASKWNH